MSTMARHDVSGLAERHFERWRRLHDERSFRIDQLTALEAAPPSSLQHESVQKALHLAATTALREIEAALARMDEGSYGLCVRCSQPVPDSRLDVLPMVALCMPCHSGVQWV